MDILISSNLERLLYHTTQGDTERVLGWMTLLNSQGRYEVDAETLSEIKKIFWAEWVSGTEARQTIRQVWEQEKYLLDPHTAVAGRQLQITK